MSVAQSKEAGTEIEAIKQFMHDAVTGRSLFKNDNAEEVKSVLKKYNKAFEKLDVTDTERFFTTESKVYESGESEGKFIYYLIHRLAPILKEYKSLTFSNYNIEVQLSEKYAFTTETYNYTIVTKGSREFKRQGVTTSMLKKIKNNWKIIISHISSSKIN